MKPRISMLALMTAFSTIAKPAMTFTGFAANYNVRESKGTGRVSGKPFHNAYSRTSIVPHQGTQECARRVRQMANGILPMPV